MISAAKAKADKKYHATHYKRFGADIKIADYDYLDNFCRRTGISKAQLIVTACKKFIDEYNKADSETNDI